MSRVVVVSNRVPPTVSRPAAGGLAAALRAALEETGGVWFGWSGELTTDNGDREVSMSRVGNFSLATIDLSKADHEGYYNGVANRTLWPLFHSRIHLTSFEAGAVPAYRRVNQLFAAKLRRMIAPDDLVWVQDYHLMLLGRELRRLGITAPLGFFLHIPFPPPEVLLTLPWHRELVESLCAFDLVGFQGHRDFRNFSDFVVRELRGQVDSSGLFRLGDKRLRAGVFPIGIDADSWAEVAASEEVTSRTERLRRNFAGETAVLGVDRLDYTKGLPERLRALEFLLQEYPEHRGKVCLLQVATPSREQVPEYRELREELEAITGRITGAFAELEWKPIHYLNKCFNRTQLAALYRFSRVGLVTPLRDGMNLVAKEYVASQDPRDPGVLVLSRFAGAAEHLTEALIINPYDEEAVARAVHSAIQMPQGERRERWQKLFAEVGRHSISDWRDRFLGTLARECGEVTPPVSLTG